MWRIHSESVVDALFKLLTSAPIRKSSSLVKTQFGALFGARVAGGAATILTSSSELADAAAAAVAAAAVGCDRLLFHLEGVGGGVRGSRGILFNSAGRGRAIVPAFPTRPRSPSLVVVVGGKKWKLNRESQPL
jgi:hypothetical protein